MRRRLGRFVILGLVGLGLGPWASADPGAAPRPNIVLILADDLGYGDLGCYGQRLIKTPHIDRLAREGVRFTQHYAGSPVCAPSRGVLMTGRHTGHAFVRGNREVEPYGQLALPEESVTVAERLAAAGYTSVLFGKWGLGVEGTLGDPLVQGFDSFLGYYCQVDAHNSFPEFLFRDGQRQLLDNAVVYMAPSHWTRGRGGYAERRQEYSNDLFLQEALRFIDSDDGGQPFFLYLPYTIPHNNGEAPEGQRNEVPSLEPYEDRPWDREDKAYAAMITRLDDYVGQILARLSSRGLDESTLVLFTSDNGAIPNPLFRSNGPLRGGKRDLYEGGVRVPLVARWPGRIGAGRLSDHVSAFWDFLPTACELAGVEPPEGCDGISYLPELLGQEQPRHSHLYWEFHWWEPARQAVRWEDWKAVRPVVASDTIELYDLASDPGETRNVAAQHPTLVERARALLGTSRTPSSEFPLPDVD